MYNRLYSIIIFPNFTHSKNLSVSNYFFRLNILHKKMLTRYQNSYLLKLKYDKNMKFEF